MVIYIVNIWLYTLTSFTTFLRDNKLGNTKSKRGVRGGTGGTKVEMLVKFGSIEVIGHRPVAQNTPVG